MTLTHEHLEKAAKMIGIEVRGWPKESPTCLVYGDDSEVWNPYVDKGQLLDLAMACDIDILPSHGGIEWATQTKFRSTKINCQDFPALAEAVILAACEQFDAKRSDVRSD